jgi:hypothetical protein
VEKHAILCELLASPKKPNFLIDRFAVTCWAARNIPLTIVVYPWAQQLAQRDRDSRQVALWREFCQGRCKAFINLFPAFLAVTAADKNWYEHPFILGDDHYSTSGNRFLFLEIARHLL